MSFTNQIMDGGVRKLPSQAVESHLSSQDFFWHKPKQVISSLLILVFSDDTLYNMVKEIILLFLTPGKMVR